MDTLLPLDKAANLYGLSIPTLRQRIANGKLKAAMSEGTLLVSEADLLAELPRKERPEYIKYAQLAGHGIGLREAARKYAIPPDTLSGWVARGFIARLGMLGAQKLQLDEADCAYCAEIYHRNPGQGKRIFNPDGTPYR